MKRRILPGSRAGTVTAPASKSHAHRLLLCAALSREESRIRCGTLSRDLLATVNCLRALGAEIREEGGALRVTPLREPPAGQALLPCGESGTTLRLLLPLAGALGARVCFRREGRLWQRPLSPLDRELRKTESYCMRRGASARETIVCREMSPPSSSPVCCWRCPCWRGRAD